MGQEILAQRIGKKLPAGLLDQVCAEIGLKRWEVQKRVQFAEMFSTEKALCDAITQWPTWFQMTQEGLVQKGKRKQGEQLIGPSAQAKREKE